MILSVADWIQVWDLDRWEKRLQQALDATANSGMPRRADQP